MFNSTFLPPYQDYETLISSSNSAPPDYLLHDKYFNGHEYLSSYKPSDNYLESQDYVEQPLINNVNHDQDSNNSSHSGFVYPTPSIMTQEMSSTNGSSARMEEESRCKTAMKKRAKADQGDVIAIRTKTQLEILDDGFKWRKYGKKMVKSNPNPRHYYKCSIEGCKVKKKVERDGGDPSYLITTYEGRHNHESPNCLIYCDELPLAISYGWTLQPSQNS